MELNKKDTHVYTLIYDKINKESNIHRDGKVIFCHKLAPFMGQSLSGQAILNRIPCSLSCGRASVMEIDGSDCFVQTCEQKEVAFLLQKAEEPKAEEPKQIKSIFQ